MLKIANLEAKGLQIRQARLLIVMNMFYLFGVRLRAMQGALQELRTQHALCPCIARILQGPPSPVSSNNMYCRQLVTWALHCGWWGSGEQCLKEPQTCFLKFSPTLCMTFRGTAEMLQT